MSVDNKEIIPPYEQKRFYSSLRGKALNRRELRLVRWFLDQLPKDSLVLDVPAGSGRFVRTIQESGHRIIAIDNDAERVNHIKKRIFDLQISATAREGDIFNLPLSDDSVDAAICIRLLHWFEEEEIRKALSELARVASHVYVTYYSKHTIEGLRKSLRGYRGNAKNYTRSQMLDWAQSVGLVHHRKVPGAGCYRRCQFLWLSK